jgi:hypothetical protein
MKFGFDFHGVLDTHQELYAALTKALITMGHEIHVVTGHRWTPEIEEMLTTRGIFWTHWFSIVDYHINLGEHKVIFEGDQPWMDAEVWNRAKAEYCEREGIDLMIDDSPVYGSHFTGTTVYCLQKNLSAQEVWMRLAGRI